jgi:hypothetical protein
MRQRTAVVGVLAGVGLAGFSVEPVMAQSRVVVPIIVQQPRSAPSTPARTSIQVTTQTVSPRPGVTQTRVTVRDTTGIRGHASSVPTGLSPGVTRVTVRDTTGIRGHASSVPTGLSPGATQVTVRDTTGIRGFASPGSSVGLNPRGAPPAPRTDSPAVIVPFPVTLQAAPGVDRQSVIITSEGPIDAPIIVLTD